MKTIEITKEQFRADLSLFAFQWVHERQAKIAEQADEIWENGQVVFILHEWAEMKRRHDARTLEIFEAMLDGRDIFTEIDRIEKDRRNGYFDVLVELLF